MKTVSFLATGYSFADLRKLVCDRVTIQPAPIPQVRENTAGTPVAIPRTMLTDTAINAAQAARNVELAEGLSTQAEDAMSELVAALLGVESATAYLDDDGLSAADIECGREELAEHRAHLRTCKARAAKVLANVANWTATAI